MIAYVLIVFGFMARLLPHAPNMVPIAAIAIFSGAYLNKKAAPWIPLAIMALSDMIIGLHSMIVFTWGAFILTGFMGMRLKRNGSWGNIFAVSVVSAALFFVITNFGVWIGWYPHTWNGLLTCYVKAVPFLRNTLLSNVAFTFILFGAYRLAGKAVGESKYRRVLLAG